MAVMSIAFEAPEAGHHPRPSGNRPIDLVHLARQTGGDKGLETEVLAIFARQVRKAVHDLPGLARKERVKLAHTVVGSARGVGAFHVARLAAALETKPADAAALAGFTQAVVDVDNFIVGLDR